MSYQRLAGIGGICFVVVVVIANIILGATSPPAYDASVEEIASYYAKNKAAIKVAVLLTPVGWALLAVFASGVFLIVRPIESERGEAWSVLGLIGVILQNATFAVVIGTDVALVLQADALADSPGATRALWILQKAMFHLNGAWLGLALIGFALGALRAGLTPKWQGFGGLIGGVIAIIGAIPVVAVAGGSALFVIGLIGFLSWQLWLLIMAIRMVTRPTARQGLEAGSP